MAYAPGRHFNGNRSTLRPFLVIQALSALTPYCPFVGNTTGITGWLPPSSVCVHSLDAMSQTLTVASSELEVSSLPSGEKATDVTDLVWPFSVRVHSPDAVSQSLTVLSSEPDARSLPSGEKATDVTDLVWPLRDEDTMRTPTGISAPDSLRIRLECGLNKIADVYN